MSKAPVYKGDYYSDEFILDPFPRYAEMRALGPVVYLPKLGNYALTQHAQVQTAMRNFELFSSAHGVAGDQFGCDLLQGNTVASDPPRHPKLRQAMAPPLLPGALETIRPEVERVAAELIDGLIGQTSFDAVEDFARHLPLKVVTEMVGLPDFGQENMLKWAGAAFDVLGVQNERGVAALDAIKEMRQFISGRLNKDNLKQGSWTYRVLELVDQGLLDSEMASFAIRDYINPSLDTTISATGQLILQLAQNPDQWEKLRQTPALCVNAVNEAVRLATPIRSFSRTTTQDTEIAGITIPAQSRVMMLMASANRDERIFANPNQFDVTRNPKDHVGFGSGIHMCIGMHLAQLEMVALLRAMIPRVGRINVGDHEIVMNNTISAMSKLPCSFAADQREALAPVVGSAAPDLLAVKVTDRQLVGKDIVSLKFESVDGLTLPSAAAGSHIDLHIQDGLVRQYSLTGNIEAGFQIAVQQEPDSSGGSVAVHEKLVVGSELLISQPRNNFPLAPGEHDNLLLSGGIGMTPHFSMAWELHLAGKPFIWHISVRTIDRLAYGALLKALPFADRILVHTDENPIKANAIERYVAGADSTTHLYLCGPKGYMEYVTSKCHAAGVPDARLHVEYFASEIDPTGDPFELVASKSDRVFTVGPDQTILEVLTGAGIAVTTSCENGVCGSCLTNVIDGKPDHRDLVLTDVEKAENTKIAVCCSRSTSKKLVLDI